MVRLRDNFNGDAIVHVSRRACRQAAFQVSRSPEDPNRDADAVRPYMTGFA